MKGLVVWFMTQGQADVEVCPLGEVVDEQAGDGRRDEHSHRGERQSLSHHRFYVAPFRVHAAGEEYDGERQHTYELRVLVAVELQSKPVGAEEHTGEEEKKQGGDAETVAPLADDDAGQDEHCIEEEEVFCSESHVREISR